MMQFESLANELLLDFFEFFHTAHLLRAFLGLNSRFNHLLYHHFQTHQFNLQSLSKEDFDHISYQHLPFIIDQIHSLRLSNDETPNLPELLLSRGFTLHQFIRLQSLSLYHLHSLDTLNQIIYQCRSLPHLTHLNIIKYHDGEISQSVVDLLNNIWSLSKLTHCHLNASIYSDETTILKISTISSSIEYLSIENPPCNLTCLSHLFKCTPRLQRLSTTVYSYSLNDHLTFLNASIKSIKLFFGGSLDSIKKLIEKMPNLSHLMVMTSQVYLDGHTWKELLSHYLPKLKIFHLKMDVDFHERNDDMEEIIDDILQSFRSSFWLEEHQWYVRCHWNPSDPYKSITLYTLPYAFDTFDYSNKCCTKSTCLDEGQYWSYNSVHIFGYSDIENTLLDGFSLVRARFPNLHHLHINLPFDDMFWLRFSSLNSLQSLTVSLYKYAGYYQLQTLFHQAPRLYSLKIESFLGLSSQLFQLTSPSIRRLDLIDILIDQSIYFNREDCLILVNSSLGRQCEVLLIRIKTRTIVFDLIEKMTQLRILIFECEDDRESFLNFSSAKNELIRWLQEHLSSTYSISRQPRKLFRIQIWINREVKKSFSADLISKHRNRFSQVLTTFRQFFYS